MHFSKTYAQILLGLPPELRENAIEYRKLKKLINQVVLELSSHGLSPPILQKLLSDSRASTQEQVTDAQAEAIISALSKVVYEIGDPNHIQPRLRLSFDPSHSPAQLEGLLAAHGASGLPPGDEVLERGETEQVNSTLSSLTHPSTGSSSASLVQHELVIPLVADGAFFTLLATALGALRQHLHVVHADFSTTLQRLTSSITSSARPMSATSSFRPYSFLSSDPTAPLRPPSALIPHNSHSDLYTWRSIFQLYMEMDVFESTKEASRGENSVDESERRLQLFVSQITQRGLNDRKRFKSKNGRTALDTFLRMNFCILDIKKFQIANTEAARKILKKHTKRTSLPLPEEQYPAGDAVSSASLPLILSLSTPDSALLPHVLVQAISETLIPIIPHIDDYACLICTSIAFKPIRLACGHLFCVRCLVKMQKRGNTDCPMCRKPCVLTADKSNVDWAMLNFMQDWFPMETKAKIKQNETEVVEEQLAELRLDSQIGCTIM